MGKNIRSGPRSVCVYVVVNYVLSELAVTDLTAATCHDNCCRDDRPYRVDASGIRSIREEERWFPTAVSSSPVAIRCCD